jgi:hypothetical protein
MLGTHAWVIPHVPPPGCPARQSPGSLVTPKVAGPAGFVYLRIHPPGWMGSKPQSRSYTPTRALPPGLLEEPSCYPLRFNVLG